MVFTDSKFVGMKADTRTPLESEGVTSVASLADFTLDNIKALAKTMRQASGRTSYPFGAMTQKRFGETVELIHFYQTVGQEYKAEALQWDTIGKDFGEQWDSLAERKKSMQAEVPILTKDLGVLRWSEAFSDFLDQ